MQKQRHSRDGSRMEMQTSRERIEIENAMTFPAPQEKPSRRLNYAEKRKAGMVERKPRARLNPVAKWRVARNAEYSKLRGEFLAENPVCQVTGCREQSCDVHHKARRGKFLLRADTFLACCRPHHQQIEENPDWAKSQGYLLTPEQRRAIA